MSLIRRMHHARRRFLTTLRDDPAFTVKKSTTQKWALKAGFITSEHALTDAGREALAVAEIDPERQAALDLLPKLVGKTLCRQTSNLPEARSEGGGFIYFTEPDHKVIPSASAKLLIAEGHLTAQEDGLFAGISQTFVVVVHG